MKNYQDEIHKIGRIYAIAALLAMLAVPLSISLSSGAWPTWDILVKGLLAVGSIYIPVGIIEVINYAPMLGIGGSYLAFVTGNIANMKLPAALTAMKQAKVVPLSDEGEVVATIAIAVSSIVTTVILILGILVLLPFKEVLITNLSPVSDYILPSIFGALGVVFVAREWKLAIVPTIVMLALFLFVIKADSIRAVLVPVASLISLFAARWMWKKGWVK